MAEVKFIDVVAGLLFEEGRLLTCQRRADGAFPLEWEFPGGKIEPGEEAAVALLRELREELGIESKEVREVLTHTHHYAGFSTVKLKFFHVPRYSGQLVNRVFEQICWVTADELVQLNFLEGDRPVVEWLTSGNARELWRGLEV